MSKGLGLPTSKLKRAIAKEKLVRRRSVKRSLTQIKVLRCEEFLSSAPSV
jgi:hypothetical protein